MRRLSIILLAIAALAATAPGAGAYGVSDLQAKLTAEMRLAGPFAGAFVRDLDSGAQLFALRENVARLPASVDKLYTTSTALLRLGATATLDTLALSDGPLGPDGVLHGDLVIAGRGDPFFGRQEAALLVDALRAAGLSHIDGAVVGDESYFDARRAGRFAGYDRDLGGVLSALPFDGGFAHGRPQLDAGVFAARRFAAALRAAGVFSTLPSRAGVAGAGAVTLAQVPSLPIATLIRLVNVPSDNFAAEMLLKTVGAQFGGGGSTAAGAAVARATLDDFGLHPRMLDGSGLSRADRTTPRQVVRLLARMNGQDVARAFRDSLAVAGQTGTLRKRMRHTPAAGRCQAKTGTLRDVSALAGYCLTAGGRQIAFAFLMNFVNPFAAQKILDRMTAAIARMTTPADVPPPVVTPPPVVPPPPLTTPSPPPPTTTPVPPPVAALSPAT